MLDSFATLNVPAPVLLDVSLSADRSQLHFAWEQYENPSPVDIGGVPTQVNFMLGGIAAYDVNGNGQSISGAFGMPNPSTEMTVATPPLVGVQRFIMGIVFYDQSGVTIAGQSPKSNEISIDFGAPGNVTIAAPTKTHGKSGK